MVELLASVFISVVVELIFYGVFYSIGWGFIRVITLGRYPGPWPASTHVVDLELVALTGLVVSIVAVVVVLQPF